jgi:hypothetical protein
VIEKGNKMALYKNLSPEMQKRLEQSGDEPTLKTEIKYLEKIIADLESRKNNATGDELERLDRELTKFGATLAKLQKSQARMDKTAARKT